MDIRFSGENAYRHLQVLTEEIGPRHGGSKNEIRAAEYIAGHFKSLGLETALKKFPIYSFEDANASLSDASGNAISCVAIPMAGVTPPGGIRKKTVYLDNNTGASIDKRVTDKIVVMFDSFEGDLHKRFLAYKPAGLVSIQTRSNMLPLRKPAHPEKVRKYGALPTVIVTLDDGLRLVRDLPEELNLTVSIEDEKATFGYNVIADLPGTGIEDDLVAVCAHYDSVWAGPGAFDNGAGTASIMELARVYKEKGTRLPMRFLAFGGEEMGVWGSKSYVKKLKDEDTKLKKNKDFERDGLRSELDRHRFLINLDMMGPLYGRSNAICLGDNDIAAATRLLANELRYAIAIQENKVYSSDNMSFNYAGIPGISFFRGPYEQVGGHTSDDTIASCSPEGLDHICHFIEAWIDRNIMSMHSFPFSRILPAAAEKAVKAWYKSKGFKVDESPLDYEVFGPERRYTGADGTTG